MKILHVLDHSTPHVDGYSVRSAAILRAQEAAGLEAVALTSPRQPGTSVPEVETVAGVAHYRTAPSPFVEVPLLRELDEMARFRRRVHEVAVRESAELIHAHSPCPWGWAALRAARRLGLPLVYEVRALWEDAAVDDGRVTTGSLRYRLSRRFETRVLRAADAVVVLSAGLRDDVRGRGVPEARVFLAPNGVDTETFRPLPRNADVAHRLGITGDCVVVGYVGSLRRWEGIEELIRAAPTIADRWPSVRFLIVGEGGEEQRLRAQVEETGLGSRVTFTGAVAHSEIDGYYSVLDVVAYPRRPSRLTEMVTPLKPLEAMAMGKAVVGADVGGIRELIADGAGLLYRAGDVPDLVRVCNELISRPDLRASLGGEARMRVSERRSWSVAASVYRQAYDSVTPASSAPARRTAKHPGRAS